MLAKPRQARVIRKELLLTFVNLAMYTGYVKTITRNREATWYEVSVSAKSPRYFRIMSDVVSEYVPSLLKQHKI
jgi:hypothetical protein